MTVGFITLDIDVWSHADLDPLIAGLDGAAFVLGDNMLSPGERFVTFELESTSIANAEEAITTFLEALAGAPPGARAAWDASLRRHLNVGVHAPREGSCAIVVSPAALGAAAAANASLEVTVYPHDASEG